MAMQAERFELLRQNQEEVEAALKQGEIDQVSGTQLTVADGYVLCALKAGLLEEWVQTFPDPRQEQEISTKVLLTGGLAAAFHGFFSQTGVPLALRSQALLEELGYGVEVLEPGVGISRRGTQMPLAFTPDAVRKYLRQVRETEPPLNVADDPHPEDVRVGHSFLEWYNWGVGPSLRNGYGAVVHSFDGTENPVCLENEHYEGSGVVKHDDGSVARGYKLGLLKSYLDQADVITGIALGPIQRHDRVLAQRLLLTTPVLQPGDLIIYDRGLLDGQLLSRLKQERQVDVIVPVKENMAILEEALRLAALQEEAAQRQGRSIWQLHPWRAGEEITRLEDLSHAWDTCAVPLNGALVRFRDKEQGWGYLLFVTTRLRLSAAQISKTYALRVEIEEDNKQVKCSWSLGQFTSTDQVAILFQIVTVLAAYSLFAYYNGTQAGRQFSHQTIQQAKRHEADSKNIRIILVARGCFVLLKPIQFGLWLLNIPELARIKLRQTFQEWAKDTSDLWPFELW